MDSPQDKQFKTIYVFFNSLATNSGRVNRLVGDLKELFPKAKLQTVEIGGKERAETKSIIEKAAKNFDEHTLVGIGGGDGTASVVIESILISSKLSEANRSAILLPLWGGNANDLACMLNGLISTTSLRRIMERANVVKVYPLRLRFNPPNSRPFVRLATCYASFGATAQAGWLMESSSHIRNKRTWFSSPPGRLIAEVFDVSRAFTRVAPFRLEAGGITKTVYERIIVNGPRIAKMEGLPVRLTDRNYYQANIDKKHFYMLLYLVKAFFGQGYGNTTDKPQQFIVKDNTWTQLDGEILQLHGGTKVELSINDKPVFAISKKISADDTEPALGLGQRMVKQFIRRPISFLTRNRF